MTHANGTNGTAGSWADLTKALEAAIPKTDKDIKTDTQFLAFATTDAITRPITFGIISAGSANAVLITVSNGKGTLRTGNSKEAEFVLSALPEQWSEFFKLIPVAPYQSYWGMYGMNIKQEGIEVIGDQEAFFKYAHFWRRSLELLHDAHCGPTPADEDPEPTEDHIVGRYVYVTAPTWGRCKVFYEQSGTGSQDILFLHTAGADSRQYHGVMNDPRMRESCKMIAFDLPGHGRSFPSISHAAGAHTNSEDSYIGCIAAMVKELKLNKPIVCGASMAGQVSLAVAIHADKVGAGGVIPLQGSDYLDMKRSWHDKSPTVNQSLQNPEWIYGMMSPTSPYNNRQLIWHLYSAQAYGVFHGDLNFYFSGWDGRSRMSSIDTKKCPVYMLTGEYDWSNTPAMSQATADKIPGGMHKAMPRLGHFPATENPALFVPYLLEAIAHIQKTRQD